MSGIDAAETLVGSSDAYRSLLAEQQVVQSLHLLQWQVCHSPYYTDMNTGKAREIDAAASRVWIRKLKAGNIYLRFNVFFEVKSAAGFHILCAGPVSRQHDFGANELWLGYSADALYRIEERLARFKLDHRSIRKFMAEVEKTAFPKNTMRTSSFRGAPMAAPHFYSAFRETNGKVDKDLDNSVLWRSVSALRSAVCSAQSSLVDDILEDLDTALEISHRKKMDPYLAADGVIERAACQLNFYTPVVVIESRLWSVGAERPVELKWFRSAQLNFRGQVQWWADVVNRAFLGEYLKDLTDYYCREFKRRRGVEL